MNGIALGVLTQNGLASSVSVMWNSSPSMVLICPSKTDGNSRLTSNVGTGSLAVATARRGGVIVGGGFG